MSEKTEQQLIDAEVIANLLEQFGGSEHKKVAQEYIDKYHPKPKDPFLEKWNQFVQWYYSTSEAMDLLRPEAIEKLKEFGVLTVALDEFVEKAGGQKLPDYLALKPIHEEISKKYGNN